MKRPTLSFTLIVLLSSWVVVTAHALPLERPRDGSVARIEGNEMELCFRHSAPPAIGDTFDIVREWTPFSKGTPATPRQIVVAHARVIVATQPPCVRAEQIDGKARRHDRVRWPLPAIAPNESR
jgi:hypothetical protein